MVPPPSWGESVMTEFAEPGSEAYDAEFAQNGGPLYVMGNRGDYFSRPTLLRKLYQDTTWEDISPSAGLSGAFTGVTAPSVNVVYVCGTGGMAYKSTDAGETWGRQDMPTRQNINAVYFIDDNHGFAVGDSGLILYTQTGGLLGLVDRDPTLPAKFELLQNYPNPFNPMTKIEYWIADFGFVTLTVYDVLGREVATLVNRVEQPGRYRVDYNGSKLAGGVYLYRLSVATADGRDRFSSTKRFVVLK